MIRTKKIMIRIFFSVIITILYATVYGQGNEEEIKRCATMEHLEMRLQQNPELQQNILAIERYTQNWIHKNASSIERNKEVIVIPVVVHVVYNTPEQNIADAQIYSQLEVLNQDYRRLNADAVNTPPFFQPVAADCRIEFCLAKRTPEDSATSGIIRKYTNVESFTLDNKVKFDSTGGSDAWDRDKYLNVWVCKLGGGFLGYASWPGDKPEVDGVVIRYQSFGKFGSAQPPYHMGRSCTHEIGHWLNLLHPWGNWGGCNDDDYVNDTPVQDGPHYYCPSYPQPSCSDTSDMFMTYMDYVDDSCMNIFTLGQRARMMAVLDSVRASLKTSNGCQPVGISEEKPIPNVQVFPNPSSGIINIMSPSSNENDFNLEVYDLLGEMIIKKRITTGSDSEISIDLSFKPSGLYFLKIISNDKYSIEKIFIVRE